MTDIQTISKGLNFIFSVGFSDLLEEDKVFNSISVEVIDFLILNSLMTRYNNYFSRTGKSIELEKFIGYMFNLGINNSIMDIINGNDKVFLFPKLFIYHPEYYCFWSIMRTIVLESMAKI